MQKLAATCKNNDVDTTTAFVQTYGRVISEKFYDEMKHVNYNLY